MPKTTETTETTENIEKTIDVEAANHVMETFEENPFPLLHSEMNLATLAAIHEETDLEDVVTVEIHVVDIKAALNALRFSIGCLDGYAQKDHDLGDYL